MVDSRSWMVRSLSSLGFAKEGRSRDRTAKAREQPRSCPNGTSDQSPGLRSYPGLPPENRPYAKGVASGRAPIPWQAAPLRKHSEAQEPVQPLPNLSELCPLSPVSRPLRRSQSHLISAPPPPPPNPAFLGPDRRTHPPVNPCQINDPRTKIAKMRLTDIALRPATNKDY
jgi:hypothetical protein